MTCSLHATALLATALLILGSLGCSSGRCANVSQEPSAWHFGPATDADGNVRLLALNSPELREAQELQPWLTDAASQAWYFDRNDRPAFVTSGFQSATREVSSTFTRDRQGVSRGVVSDNYHQTTYRSTFTETVR